MSDSGKAVFLSYASQDAEAAKRICDALRAAGVEVWFDQSELVGGDQWDGKIRGQISSCALFVPIISANTQARLEGYFRLEWKLAGQRTHTMADAKPFLLPVVIDATRDAEAHVPAEFKSVQWTKLPGGETPPAFCARVKKLLSGEVGSVSDRPPRTDPQADTGQRPVPPQKSPRWLAPVIAGGVIALLALVLTRPWEKAEALPAEPSARRSAPTTTETSSAPATEARQLLAKAWVLLNKPEMARAELDAADALCKRAAALDATDAGVWAAWSQVNVWYCFHNLDRSAPRQEAAREYASRAMQLDARSYEARLAQAFYWVRGEANSRRAGEAQRLLRELLRERPDEPRALFTLGYLLIYAPENEAEGVALLERLARNPGFAAVAWDETGWAAYFKRDWAKAEAAIAQSLAAQPYWNNLGLKITMAERVYGDMDLAESTLKQMPASALQEDWGIGFACEVYQWRREPLRTIEVLEGVSRDWIHYFFYSSPKAFLLGEARLMANQASAARRDFQRARVLIEKQLADDPNNGSLLGLQARTLLYLGEKEEAEKIYRSVKELGGTDYLQFFFAPPEAAIAFIRSMTEAPQGDVIGRTLFSTASLRLDPQFDRFRAEPAFQVLLADLENGSKAAASRSPASGLPSSSSPPPVDSKSVAVLAFANLSDDKGNEYFSDGISEELLNVLAKIPGLKVTARTSSFHFKGKDTPIPEIASQLGVAYVVEGSVRKQGDKVRITAQLIKAADGFHVWSETYDRQLKDLFAVQDEIAGLIAQNLSLKVGVTATAAGDPEAYRLRLEARFFAQRENNEGWKKAIELYRASLALEPGAAVGWAEMAKAYTSLGRYGGMTFAESFREARMAAERALTLDHDLAQAHSALGWVRRTADWDWKGADQSFRRALALAPRSAEIIRDNAVLAMNLGRMEEAGALVRQAVELDPLNAAGQNFMAVILAASGRLAEAERALTRAIELAPTAVGYHAILSAFQTEQKHWPEAAATAELEPSESYRLFARAYVQYARGERAAGAATQGELITKYADAMGFYVAAVYVRAGDPDRAFEWLDRAFKLRDSALAWCKTSWAWHQLHPDPRWPVFLQKLGLTDEQLK